MIRRRALLAGSAFLGLGAPPAHAASEVIPVEASVQGCLVTVMFDGRAARMRLDTGAQRTLITHAAALRLGLRPDPWVASTMRGAGGLLARYANMDVRIARAGAVALYQSAPGAPLSLPVTDAALGVDGLLGGDLLRHYTLDLDTAAGALRLLPPMRLPSRAVSLIVMRQDLLLAPVLLDGRKLTALVDTGATISLVNARGLYKLGLAGDAPGDRSLSVQGAEGAFAARRHRFAALRIGPVTLPQPTLLTMAAPEAAFDMVLGFDLLGRQRMLLSYAEPSLLLAS